MYICYLHIFFFNSKYERTYMGILLLDLMEAAIYIFEHEAQLDLSECRMR